MKELAHTKKSIAKKLRSGYPAGELKNDLMKQGYSEAEIDLLFLHISSQRPEPGKGGKSKTPEMHVLTLLGVTLIITGVALMGTRIWLTEYAPFMIVLGAIGTGAGYYISYNRKN